MTQRVEYCVKLVLGFADILSRSAACAGCARPGIGGCRAFGVALGLLVVLAVPASGVRIGERAGNERLSVDGYAHIQWVQDFRAGAWPAFGFILRRARFSLEYEFAERAAFEMEVGADRLALEVKDAFVAYRIGRPLRLVAGLQKMPFSREELTPASRLVTVERGAANDRFGSMGFLGRDIGLVAEGGLFAPRLGLGYALGVFNGNRARRFRDDNDAKQFVERLTFEPSSRFALGLNATQRNDSLSGRLVHAFGGDAALKLGPAAVELEALCGNADSAAWMAGAWLVGSARLGALEPVLRLEHLRGDPQGDGAALTALSAGLNWYLQRRVRLKTDWTARFGTQPGAGSVVTVEAQAGF